jgi:hypothetical protein
VCRHLDTRNPRGVAAAGVEVVLGQYQRLLVPPIGMKFTTRPTIRTMIPMVSRIFRLETSRPSRIRMMPRMIMDTLLAVE